MSAQQQCNGRVSEPHCFRLLVADSGVTEYQHQACRAYMALCGAVLAASRLPASWCEDGCERGITYCLGCLHRAVEFNANAGLVWSPPGTGLEVGR